jgi:hypothetical protein
LFLLLSKEHHPLFFYGIGDEVKGTADTFDGRYAVEQDSIHLNMDNPASYANLKLTTFAVGGSYNTTQMKSSTVTESARRTN